MNSIPELIDDLRDGKMVIILDDEDRENEGDLIMSAECVTAASVNFMITHGRGLFCLPMDELLCDKLGLKPMAAVNRCKFGTNFTVSIEAAEGVSTGISASDRATTVLTAVSDHVKPEDLVSPGHVFPIAAKHNGVLARRGHTEAVCDLMRLAGFKPAGVLIEILNADGTMARRPQCEIFAKQHGLKMGTIADLIKFRIED